MRGAAHLALAAMLALGGCQLVGAGRDEAPRFGLRAVGFDQLAGWSDDNAANAVPAFLKSCAAIAARNADEPLDPAVKHGDFGTVGEWRRECAAAARLPGTDAAAKQFFEANFVPLLASSGGSNDGLFAGYYEISLDGSYRRGGRFQTPLYRRPPNPGEFDRAQIDAGALAGRGLELLWVDDPINAYFLAVQGSGVVHMPDGATIRVSADGSNGRPYVPIGGLLASRGQIALRDLTLETLHAWIASHGAAGIALMHENPSYVFFKKTRLPGAVGTEDVVLTPERSLAVDRDYIPLGVPLWLDAKERFIAGTVRRLVVAQDTADAVKGPVRGDLFWGSDAAAASAAGTMDALGEYYLLVPQAVAPRAIAAAREN